MTQKRINEIQKQLFKYELSKTTLHCIPIHLLVIARDGYCFSSVVQRVLLQIMLIIQNEI